MGFIPTRFIVLLCGLIFTTASAVAQIVSGPVEARVIRVIDGDTFVAEALVWPGHIVQVAVRIRGIDAPEMRSNCAAEKEAAVVARSELERLVGERPVHVSNIGGGKYFGRVLADVFNADGDSIGTALLGLDIVRPYDGGKRKPFCEK